MKQDVDVNITQGSSYMRDGYADDGEVGQDNSTKKWVCIGSIVGLIVVAIILMVALVPTGDSAGGDPVAPGGDIVKCLDNQIITAGGTCKDCPEYQRG